ncbi:MAG TPA: hypothetical protein VJ508_11485, partial [Saprospiraceae bacterium]|nr:hypothetical protein [Saprospiraceae bacterium]
MTDLIMLDEIKALVEIKNSRCLTLIVPTHRQGQEKRIDHILLKNLVENARTLAYEKYGKANAEPLLELLKDMITNLDFDHLQDGLGLYISADTQKTVRFPFAVETKVSVDDHFEVRELVYKSSLSLPYHVLVLTEKEGRLFDGT